MIINPVTSSDCLVGTEDKGVRCHPKGGAIYHRSCDVYAIRGGELLQTEPGTGRNLLVKLLRWFYGCATTINNTWFRGMNWS